MTIPPNNVRAFGYLERTRGMSVLLALFVMMTIGACPPAQAQVVYEDKKRTADILVYEVERERRTDLRVYRVDDEFDAKGNRGLWYFAEDEFDADKTIHFVDRKRRADLKVYFVENERNAGWNEFRDVSKSVMETEAEEVQKQSDPDNRESTSNADSTNNEETEGSEGGFFSSILNAILSIFPFVG